MLTTRTRPDRAGTGTLSASAIERLIREHPLAQSLSGTVVVGCGTARLLRPSDLRPWVIIPCARTARPDALGLAQVALADAVVVADEHEVAMLRPHIESVPIVVRAGEPDSSAPFLPTASPDASIAARDELLTHPALAVALLGQAGTSVPLRMRGAMLADAAIEALVAVTDSPLADRR